jgi:hypothetical protein
MMLLTWVGVIWLTLVFMKGNSWDAPTMSAVLVYGLLIYQWVSFFLCHVFFPASSNFHSWIQLIGPYALGVLPKANFFAELVQSMEDNPVKPVDSTANSRPASAMAHSRSSYKIKESGIGMILNHLYISFSFYYLLRCFFFLITWWHEAHSDNLSLLSCFCANSSKQGSWLTFDSSKYR